MARNQYREYYLQLINSRTMSPIDDDTGVYNVYTVSTPAEATIYSDTNGTSQANPGTISNGIIRFYTASSVLSVDVSILTASGHAIFVEALTSSQHRVLVNPDEWRNQKLIIGMTLPGVSTTIAALVDTGFDLPAHSLTREAYLHITTVATDTDVDLGTSTDTDGFLDGIDTSATGLLGLVEDLTAGSIGALLATTTSSAIRKVYVPANATSGKSIVWAMTGTATATTAFGYIYIIYDLMPTVGN